jgi:hypothetical protein
MKKIVFLFIAALFVTALQAQKVINDPNVELRKVESFNAVEVSGGIDLYLSAGDEAVAVSAKDEKVRSRMKTEVKNGVLKIYLEWKDGIRLSIGSSDHMKAYVSYKTLKALSGSGGSDISVDGTIQSGSFKLDISGGSDFKGKVNVEDMEINQSGGADVNISGTARILDVHASGGSDLDGYDLVTDVCDIHASGGSDITITVNKEISAEASGASDVSWKGGASVKKANASGAGSVSHRS